LCWPCPNRRHSHASRDGARGEETDDAVRSWKSGRVLSVGAPSNLEQGRCSSNVTGRCTIFARPNVKRISDWGALRDASLGQSPGDWRVRERERGLDGVRGAH
jgi:hypothetical protein